MARQVRFIEQRFLAGTALVRQGEEPTKIAIAGLVLHEQDDMAVAGGDLGGHDVVEAELLRGDMGSDGAVKTAAIGNGHGRETELVRLVHHLFRRRGAFEEGKITFPAELGKFGRPVQSKYPCKNARPVVRSVNTQARTLFFPEVRSRRE